jgi:hypothetical protein
MDQIRAYFKDHHSAIFATVVVLQNLPFLSGNVKSLLAILGSVMGG